jgi:phosphoglycerate dehydrogenase-like enzyme
VASGKAPVIVVEDDPFTRLVGVVLDPNTSAERRTAFADFFAHDEPDFDGYCARVRARTAGLFPAEVRLLDSAAQLRHNIADADMLVVESFPVGRAVIEAASRLAVIQKFGVGLRNIDTAACTAQGIKVLTIRRRANIACAEHAICLMLALAKKLNRLTGRISVEKLADAGYRYKPYDRRHTANSNWARIPGIRTLNEATLGIIGLGEIGREIAIRATAFGMRVIYHQRNRLADTEEQALQVTYAPFEGLLAEADYVVPQVAGGPQNRGLIDATRLAQMKAGAFLVNIARADVVDRAALIAALRSGRLGGFALDPLYEAPGRDDDELLTFDNVIITPHIAAQPRFNALNDFEDMIVAMAREFGS